MQRWQKKRQTKNGRKQTVNCYSCHALSLHGCLYCFISPSFGNWRAGLVLGLFYLCTIPSYTRHCLFLHLWFDFGFGIRRFPFLLPQIGVDIMCASCASTCEWIKNELAKIDLIQINFPWPSHSHWHHIEPPFFYTLMHRWVSVIRQIVKHVSLLPGIVFLSRHLINMASLLASHKNHRNYGNFSHFIDCTMYAHTYVFSVPLTVTETFHFVVSSREFLTDFIGKLSRPTSVIHFAMLFYRWNFRLPAYQRPIFDYSFKKECSQFSLNFVVVGQQCRHTRRHKPTTGNDCLNKFVCARERECAVDFYFFRMLYFQFEYIVSMAPLC